VAQSVLCAHASGEMVWATVQRLQNRRGRLGAAEVAKARLEITMTRIGISGGQLRHLSLEVVVRKAEEFGADAIELHWGMNVHDMQDVEKLKGLLEASGKTADVLNAELFWSPGELRALPELNAKFDRCLEAARLLESRFMLVYCACSPRKELDDPEAVAERRRYLDAVRPCAAACAEHGITLVVENYYNTFLRTPKATLRLLQEAEPLGLRLAFDPSNYYNSGEEPFPLAFHLLKDYISVIHVKDSARAESSIYRPDVKVVQRVIPVVFLPLGKGAVNWDGICDELNTIGYKGPMTVEPNTGLDQLETTLAANIRYLRHRGFGEHA